MANCPKCGYKLRMIDIKAECPKCGVNLLYYNQQERLALDADMAEEEHIRMQPKIDRIKFAFVGTKLSIVRLISFLIPIGVMFLPLASVNVDMPWNTIDKNISILNVVMDILMNLKIDILIDMIKGSELTRVAFIFYAAAIIFILLAAVFAILNIPFDAVSCSPKGFKRNVTLSSCGIVFTVLSIVSFLVFNSQLSKAFGEIYSGSIGIGGFLVILGFAIIIVVNILIKKQNIPVKYTDVSEYVERIARRKEEIAEMEAQAAIARKAYKERMEAEAKK